ncbi:MAG TPA: hypothetical protein VK539_34035 [Myxococcaceae bacterium]|nr:hypothetical protein [Myxococcaceae bacterium]
MIEVDEKLWPLVLIRYEAPLSMEDLELLSARLSDILARQEPYVAIADARRSQGMTPEQRQHQADWMKRHDTQLRKYCLGSAFIVTSALARMTVSVIFALKPPPLPYTIVTTLEAAAVWAADRLAAAGRTAQAQRVLTVHGPKVTPVPLKS